MEEKSSFVTFFCFIFCNVAFTLLFGYIAALLRLGTQPNAVARTGFGAQPELFQHVQLFSVRVDFCFVLSLEKLFHFY